MNFRDEADAIALRLNEQGWVKTRDAIEDLARRAHAAGGVPSTPEGAMEFIDVVFDGPPGPQGGRFVEVEDADGRSIRVGEWVAREEGMWALRIPIVPILVEPKP